MRATSIYREDDFDPVVQRAIDQIYSDYGDRVSVRQKAKSLRKFGKNTALGTSEETIWLTGGNETYPAVNTNPIDTVSSSDAGDTQIITVEGHTSSGGVMTFVSQSATLNGQNKVALGTPLHRITRLFNNSATEFAGTVYGYEDDTVTAGVPQTAAKIHIQTEGDNNQSLKASTSISNTDYWIITSIYAVVDEKTAASVDFSFQIRELGKVFRTRIPVSASSNGGATEKNLSTALIVPKNADFRITGTASTTNVSVEAWAEGPLAVVL